MVRYTIFQDAGDDLVIVMGRPLLLKYRGDFLEDTQWHVKRILNRQSFPSEKENKSVFARALYLDFNFFPG